MSVKRITILVFASAILLGFTFLGVNEAVKAKDRLQFRGVELMSRSTEIKNLQLRYNNLNLELKKASDQQNVSQEQLDKLNKEKEDLEKQKQDLEQQLQAKLEEKNNIAAAASVLTNKVTRAHAAYAASGIDCNNQNTAKDFIYCHESGNVADKSNGSGCYGLGQDCNGIVRSKCGPDYACQDEYFTEYMQHRYGSWEAAKAFWLSRAPINGRDVGNWW
jgi:hypothetical protein